MRFGCVGKLGPIVEEINEMHTHDYDQLILFYSTSPDDMLGLGATVEVALGETGERHKFTVPTAVSIPKGTPHFPARVLSMDRDIYCLSLSCAPEVKEIPYATKLTPESGPLARMRAQYSKNVSALRWQNKCAYLYGSEAYEASGGVHTGFSGSEAGVELLMTWQSIRNAHTMGPRTPAGTHAPHVHPFDELAIMVGADTDNPNYLGGNCQICLGKEAEPHKISVPSVALFPKRLPHCPLSFEMPDKPYFLVLVCCSGSHETATQEQPKQ